MPFHFEKLEIPDVLAIEIEVFKDSRGLFAEVFKRSTFKTAGIDKTFPQINTSLSKKHVLRGLHYQIPPYAQAKLIRVVRGEIFDVAVDIRKGSPTYGSWVGISLSERNKKLLYVPEGFAHGFLTCSSEAEIIYYCTNEYAASHERGIAWNDPEIGISWGLDTPILSEKDQQAPRLAAAENTFSF